MKKLLVLALMALMVCGAFAQTPAFDENSMGVFFTDDVAAIVDASADVENVYSNTAAFGAPVFGYLVLMNPSLESIGGYECRFEFDQQVWVLEVAYPFNYDVNNSNGTNFGTPTNQIVGYTTPIPVNGSGAVVLARMNMIPPATVTTNVMLHGTYPPSIDEFDTPVIADGGDPDILVQCQLTCAGEGGGDHIVATFNGTGVVPAEPMSFSGVKALFQ